MTLENIQFVISLATLVGFIFIVYRTFHEPDVKADKAIELLKERVKSEKQISIQTIKTIQNHVHSLEGQVNENGGDIKSLTNAITRLETIIDERIPKRL